MPRAKGLLILICAAAFLTACGGIPPLSRLRGHMQAQSDVSKGQLRLLQWGLLYEPPGNKEYESLLKSRYGIEFRIVAGCVITNNQDAYWTAYNAVMRDAIQRKYGPDVFERTAAEARRTAPKQSPL